MSEEMEVVNEAALAPPNGEAENPIDPEAAALEMEQEPAPQPPKMEQEPPPQPPKMEQDPPPQSPKMEQDPPPQSPKMEQEPPPQPPSAIEEDEPAVTESAADAVDDAVPENMVQDDGVPAALDEPAESVSPPPQQQPQQAEQQQEEALPMDTAVVPEDPSNAADAPMDPVEIEPTTESPPLEELVSEPPEPPQPNDASERRMSGPRTPPGQEPQEPEDADRRSPSTQPASEAASKPDDEGELEEDAENAAPGEGEDNGEKRMRTRKREKRQSNSERDDGNKQSALERLKNMKFSKADSFRSSALRDNRTYRFRPDRSPRKEDDDDERRSAQESDARRREADEMEAIADSRRGRSTMFFLQNEQQHPQMSAPVRNALQAGPLKQRVENFVGMSQDHAFTLPPQELIALIVHGVELMREQDKFIDGRRKQLIEMEKMNATEKERIQKATEDLPPDQKPNLAEIGAIFGVEFVRPKPPTPPPVPTGSNILYMANGTSQVAEQVQYTYAPAPIQTTNQLQFQPPPVPEALQQPPPQISAAPHQIPEPSMVAVSQALQVPQQQQSQPQNGTAQPAGDGLPKFPPTSSLLYSAPPPIISSAQASMQNPPPTVTSAPPPQMMSASVPPPLPPSIPPPNFSVPPPMTAPASTTAPTSSTQQPTSTSVFINSLAQQQGQNPFGPNIKLEPSPAQQSTSGPDQTLPVPYGVPHQFSQPPPSLPPGALRTPGLPPSLSGSNAVPVGSRMPDTSLPPPMLSSSAATMNLSQPPPNFAAPSLSLGGPKPDLSLPPPNLSAPPPSMGRPPGLPVPQKGPVPLMSIAPQPPPMSMPGSLAPMRSNYGSSPNRNSGGRHSGSGVGGGAGRRHGGGGGRPQRAFPRSPASGTQTPSSTDGGGRSSAPPESNAATQGSPNTSAGGFSNVGFGTS